MTAGVEHWKKKLQAELDEIINDVSEKAYKELGWHVQRELDKWYDRADNYLEDAGDAYADGIPHKDLRDIIARARLKSEDSLLNSLKAYIKENM